MNTSNATLEEAKDWLRSKADKGAKCPCCTQYTKIYSRKLRGNMAKTIIRMYRTNKLDWVYLPSIRDGAAPRDDTLSSHWGLIEEAKEKRDDGGRAGWWRVTEKGEAFIRGQIKVPKYVRLFDGRVLGFTGDDVSIFDALGTKFDYQELMNGE